MWCDFKQIIIGNTRPALSTYVQGECRVRYSGLKPQLVKGVTVVTALVSHHFSSYWYSRGKAIYGMRLFTHALTETIFFTFDDLINFSFAIGCVPFLPEPKINFYFSNLSWDLLG